MTSESAPPSRALLPVNFRSGPMSAKAKPSCATPPPDPARATLFPNSAGWKEKCQC
jgi:hypothetical protein